jgi:hypothetical protein
MTDECQKPEEEVSEEEMEDVSGGGLVIEDKRIMDIARTGKTTKPLDKKLTEPLDKSMEREGTIE